jgi:membrane protease YdiL (CAAX protease family)
MTYDFVVPTPRLRPRLRDVVYGLALSSIVGSIVLWILLWPTVMATVRGELTTAELEEALLEPVAWTMLAVALFELYWVTRLVMVRGSGSFRADLGLDFRTADLGLGVAGWVAIFGGGLLMDSYLIPRILPGAVDVETYNPLAGYAEVDSLVRLVLFATIGLLVPVVEELLFRGVLLGTFSRWLGPIPAIVVSSGIFGFLHASTWTAHDLAYVIWATWAGVILAVLRVATARLGAGILAHAITNCLAVAVALLDA